MLDIKFIDFGISKDFKSQYSKIPIDKESKDDLRYFAPEQFSHRLSFKSDIW